MVESSPRNEEIESEKSEEKFEWYKQRYPMWPVCDLDKRRPHAKKVIGIDLVVWWDRNENAWKVFDDSCSHRLAPLTEWRIDPWGRLQHVYHGWCFGGAGDCKFIPQALCDGPPMLDDKVYDDEEGWFRSILANSKKEDVIQNQYEFFTQRMGGLPLFSQRRVTFCKASVLAHRLRFATLLHQCFNSIKKRSLKKVALASHIIGFAQAFI